MQRHHKALTAALVLAALSSAAQEPWPRSVAYARVEAGAAAVPAYAVAVPAEPAYAEPAPPPKQSFQLVYDVLHTIETIYNGLKMLDQLGELRSMVDSAERNLEKLSSIPFVDDANFTGAFLENMLFNLDVASPWSFHHEGIEQILSEHFVGTRSYLGLADPNAYPPGGRTFSEHFLGRYDELLRGLLRRYAILEEHTHQLSRERQGLDAMRTAITGADGETQHLEHIAATLHQMADAQSVDRQVAMLDVSQRFLSEMAAVSGRAETATLRLTAIFGWKHPDGMPMHHGGMTVALGL